MHRKFKMDKNLEKIGNELQKLVDAETRKIYSEKVIQYFNRHENMGRMNAPDGSAYIKGPCGDTMEMYLEISGDNISKACFFTDGCVPTIACGSSATKLVEGKNIHDAMKIAPADILNELDGLPEINLHCAILAINTLYKALADFLLQRQI